jgi:hypothetical protein
MRAEKIARGECWWQNPSIQDAVTKTGRPAVVNGFKYPLLASALLQEDAGAYYQSLNPHGRAQLEREAHEAMDSVRRSLVPFIERLVTFGDQVDSILSALPVAEANKSEGGKL